MRTHELKFDDDKVYVDLHEIYAIDSLQLDYGETSPGKNWVSAEFNIRIDGASKDLKVTVEHQCMDEVTQQERIAQYSAEYQALVDAWRAYKESLV